MKEQKNDTQTRVDEQTAIPPERATAASHEVFQTAFIPKRACEGAATFDSGAMCECRHTDCGIHVAWDMVNHKVFGFAAVCPLKRRA